MPLNPTPAAADQAATRLVGLSDDIVDRLLRRSLTLADDLQRAARTLAAAISEADGTSTVRTRLELLRAALGAAEDCAGLLDSSRCLAGATLEVVELGGDLIRRILATLRLLAAGCGIETTPLTAPSTRGHRGRPALDLRDRAGS